MTRDNIIRMAKEAGWKRVDHPAFPVLVERIERFAALVAAAEREACVAIAEKEFGNTAMLLSLPPKSSAAWNIWASIRARGEA